MTTPIAPKTPLSVTTATIARKNAASNVQCVRVDSGRDRPERVEDARARDDIGERAGISGTPARPASPVCSSRPRLQARHRPGAAPVGCSLTAAQTARGDSDSQLSEARVEAAMTPTGGARQPV
jgi:hypothetical protein